MVKTASAYSSHGVCFIYTSRWRCSVFETVAACISFNWLGLCGISTSAHFVTRCIRFVIFLNISVVRNEFLAGTTNVWYSDGIQPKQLWFEVQTNIMALKAYSANSQKGILIVCSSHLSFFFLFYCIFFLPSVLFKFHPEDSIWTSEVMRYLLACRTSSSGHISGLSFTRPLTHAHIAVELVQQPDAYFAY